MNVKRALAEIVNHSLFPEKLERISSDSYFRIVSARANRDQDVEMGSPVESNFDEVVVICIDALRPDFQPDIPLSWDLSVTPAPWTFPSVTSYMSGQYPHEHGAVAHTRPGDETYAMPEQSTPESTLPQTFARAGFDTAGLFAFPIPFMATRGWFRHHRVWGKKPAESLLEYYQSWQQGRDRTFAYIHVGDLHVPLNPPEKYVRERDVDTSLPDLAGLSKYATDYDPESEECQCYRKHRLGLYAAALDYVEDQLTSFISKKGEDTLVVVTGDHGEAHWEHTELDRQFTDSRPNYGLEHGGTPLDTVARVPVGASKFNPPRETTSLTDLPRTILDATFPEVPDRYGGVSWLNGVESRPVVCEGSRYGTERKAVYLDDRKIIRSRTDEVTLSARVTSSGEDFDAEIETDDLVNALPGEWDQNSHSEPSALVEDQLSALGYK